MTAKGYKGIFRGDGSNYMDAHILSKAITWVYTFCKKSSNYKLKMSFLNVMPLKIWFQKKKYNSAIKKKGWSTDTCYHMEETKKHYVKLRKPDTKKNDRYNLWSHLCETVRKDNFIETVD